MWCSLFENKLFPFRFYTNYAFYKLFLRYIVTERVTVVTSHIQVHYQIKSTQELEGIEANGFPLIPPNTNN